MISYWKFIRPLARISRHGLHDRVLFLLGTVVLLLVIAQAQAQLVGEDQLTHLCGRASFPYAKSGTWLEGGWGVRTVIPAGSNSEMQSRFMGDVLLDQLIGLRSARWVMLNLTAPSFGGLFTSSDAALERDVSADMVPGRDLLGHYIDALRGSGFRIILYVASQGPSLDFLKPNRVALMKDGNPKFYEQLHSIDKAWRRHLDKNGLSSQQAFANVIERYSQKLGDKVDGWWFDHGVHADPDLLIPAAKAGNADALVAWNGRPRVIKSDKGGSPVWLLKRSNAATDYVDGHVSPTRKNGRGENPWWEGNELLIRQVEECPHISGALKHVFVPLQSTWRAGKEVFPTELATEWTQRITVADGGVTWAAALKSPEYQHNSIDPVVLGVLQKIDQAMRTLDPSVKRRGR